MIQNYTDTYLDEINRAGFYKLEEKNYFDSKTVTSLTVKNGIVLPWKEGSQPGISGGGVTDAQGNYLESSAQRLVGTEMSTGYPITDCIEDSRSVVWFGGFHTHWGHFLTEMVSRCWYFVEHKEQVKDFYVAYVRRTDIGEKPMQGNFLEFLELLGIQKDHVIEVSEPTRFKEVIVPELSCRAGVFYTRQFQSIFNEIRDNVNTDEPIYEKVYFTRLKSKNFSRTEIGEKKIKKLFERNGYHVLAPEHCSLRQQIHYIKTCKKLTVISGTLSHNILFGNDGIDITVINRTGDGNYYQSMINQMRNARITYIDAHLSLLPVFSEGPFLLYVSNRVLQYARDHEFSIKGVKENPIAMHIKIVWYYLYYMDRMTGECIEQWGLKEAYGEYIMGHYAFYRDRIPFYDDKTLHRLRKCFYILARMVG